MNQSLPVDSEAGETSSARLSFSEALSFQFFIVPSLLFLWVRPLGCSSYARHVKRTSSVLVVFAAADEDDVVGDDNDVLQAAGA